MELLNGNISVNDELQTEEDVDCFFLQPSSSPYNITEKIQQANIDLYSSNPGARADKVPKVKFRDDLFSFEPDLTDEDVKSIESDHVEEQDSSLQYDYKTINIPQIEELPEDVEDDDEIIESINTDFNELEIFQPNKVIDVKVKDEKLEKIIPDKIVNVSERKKSNKKNSTKTKSKNRVKEVHCKDHCIDKLDFDLPMYIKKLEIHEKPPSNLPPLQLLQRKCCDELKQKVQKNLPNYNGFRSEYGLTSRQIDAVRKQKELTKLKEENRRKILEEYKKRKIQQNEEVFSQWVREVAQRRQERENERQKKSKITQKSTLSKNSAIKVKERPKTANDVATRTHFRKARRPHTSTCVFIEVPQSLLKKGLHFGDLLVTNSKLTSRKFHILTISS